MAWGRLLNLFRTLNARLNERLFRAEANSHLGYLEEIKRCLPGIRVAVDLGAGSVGLERYLPAEVPGKILWVSVDHSYESLAKNGHRLRVVADAEALPFQERKIHLMTSSCFLEHVENPVRMVSECYRVLEKGGRWVFYTPNRNSYVATLARMTPLSFHRLVRRLQTGKPFREIEVCKTYYRMNTLKDLKRHRGRFRIVRLDTVMGSPSYSTFLPPPIHLLFMAFHGIVQRSPWLRRRVGENIVGCWTKTEGTSA